MLTSSGYSSTTFNVSILSGCLLVLVVD